MSRRIRTIRPEVLLEDERAASLSDSAFRLWVGLRMLADDFGTFRAADRYLAAQVWQDTGRARKVPALLAELTTARLVALFEADGTPYGSILTWPAEQRVDDPSERTSLPRPPESIQALIDDLAAKVGKSPRAPGSRGDSGKVAARARPRASSPREGDLEREGDPDPEGRGTGLPPAGPVYDVPRAFAVAYATGVGRATATAPAVMTRRADFDLLMSAIDAHARGRDGRKLTHAADVTVWVERTAEAFGREADDFQGRRRGFAVSGFVDWLNGRSAKPPARAGVQPAAEDGPSWRARGERIAPEPGAGKAGTTHG